MCSFSLPSFCLITDSPAQLFGYTREEMVGQPIEMLIPERYRGHHTEYRAEYVAHPEIRAMGHGRELFGRRKDGSEFPVEVGLNPLQTPQGPLVMASIGELGVQSS